MSRSRGAPPNSRRSWNKRGNHNSRGAPRKHGANLEPEDPDIMRGLKEVPLEIVPVPLSVQDDPNVMISETTFLGSYNWTARSIPTIVVPGMPGRWLDRKPFQVDRDTGICIVDQNTHRFMESSLLPLLVAADMNEEADTFDWAAVDFLTDRNALRKILRWTAAEGARDFRIDLQLAGKKTILMTRWDNKTTEAFLGFTYGFNYFNACTSKGHPESTGHHRIINYKMNGLNMVVRYTVDGYLSGQAVSSVDDVADGIASLNVSKERAQATPVKGTSLHIIPFGEIVPQESILEIATISKAREDQLDWDEKTPQLFLSQTHHFYLGLHDRGFFKQVRKEKFDQTKMSEKVRTNMKRLRRALGLIQDVVFKYGQCGRLSLVCVGGTLKVYERMSKDSTFLPDEQMQRFGV
ncbi:hypothetical protein JOM56_010614 [Amanita muscaria]